MDVKAIMLDEKDTVATCMYGAHIGDVIVCVGGTGVQVLCTEEIPLCHKVALKNIAKDEPVYKYGEIIGAATESIEMGGWVSHANIHSIVRDYESEII